HYDCQLPWFFIEENDWGLTLEDRRLEFCFTPYVPFPESFMTYDPVARVIFTCDIFGCSAGFPQPFFAYNLDYIEQMKTFHHCHIAANRILVSALDIVASHTVDIIAPQSGSLFGKKLLPSVIKELKTVDCGIDGNKRGN
ncbi:MAG: diguanylate cyclase, partial [Desulfobulbus propionicus]